MTSTVDTTGPIALNDVIIARKRLPQIEPHEPPAQPTDTVDLSDAAKKIADGGIKPLAPVIAEAPDVEPIVTYADGFYPVKQAPITEPATDEPTPVAIDGPYTPPKKTPVATTPKSPIARDVPVFPRKPLTPVHTPSPIASNQPVTIDTVYTLNPKFASKAKAAEPTPQTSGAARLSSISGHFIAPYNTAQYLELFKD